MDTDKVIRWEYKVDRYLLQEDVVTQLNHEGNSCWELVAITPIPSSRDALYTFKRPNRRGLRFTGSKTR